jgi:hypothetical protein
MYGFSTRQILQILTVSMVICSCGHKSRSHDGHRSKDTSINEKVELEKDCSWEADSLDGEKVLTIVDKMPDYNGGMRKYHGSIGKEIRIPNNYILDCRLE